MFKKIWNYSVFIVVVSLVLLIGVNVPARNQTIELPQPTASWQPYGNQQVTILSEPVSRATFVLPALEPAKPIADYPPNDTPPDAIESSVSDLPITDEDIPILPRIDITEDVINLMGRIIHSESHYQSYEGRLMVSQCILDRAECWEKSVERICLANKQFTIARNHHGCDDCLQAAIDAINGARALDGYYILNFRKVDHNRDWYTPYITTIGNHKVYGYAREVK